MLNDCRLTVQAFIRAQACFAGNESGVPADQRPSPSMTALDYKRILLEASELEEESGTEPSELIGDIRDGILSSTPTHWVGRTGWQACDVRIAGRATHVPDAAASRADDLASPGLLGYRAAWGFLGRVPSMLASSLALPGQPYWPDRAWEVCLEHARGSECTAGHAGQILREWACRVRPAGVSAARVWLRANISLRIVSLLLGR